jgi:protein CpxP
MGDRPTFKETKMQATTTSKTMKRWAGGLLAVALATTAAVGWAHGGRHGDHGGPMGGGPGMFMGAQPERIDRMVDRMLKGVDATEAQRTQIRQIAQAAARDVRSQAESGRALHEKARALFTAPTVDEAAVESLRQQMAAHHDAVSKRMSQAMVEAAKVLTPEQRKKLAERFDKRRGHMRDHMRGGARGERALPGASAVD